MPKLPFSMARVWATVSWAPATAPIPTTAFGSSRMSDDATAFGLSTTIVSVVVPPMLAGLETVGGPDGVQSLAVSQFPDPPVQVKVVVSPAGVVVLWLLGKKAYDGWCCCQYSKAPSSRGSALWNEPNGSGASSDIWLHHLGYRYALAPRRGVYRSRELRETQEVSRRSSRFSCEAERRGALVEPVLSAYRDLKKIVRCRWPLELVGMHREDRRRDGESRRRSLCHC